VDKSGQFWTHPVASQAIFSTQLIHNQHLLKSPALLFTTVHPRPLIFTRLAATCSQRSFRDADKSGPFDTLSRSTSSRKEDSAVVCQSEGQFEWIFKIVINQMYVEGQIALPGWRDPSLAQLRHRVAILVVLGDGGDRTIASSGSEIIYLLVWPECRLPVERWRVHDDSSQQAPGVLAFPSCIAFSGRII